ncbi:hypothetical protein CHLRE_10g461300v5 [Chlamydomonas reinhardtii]|nr:uncharacterized protein CHLRE_10g461300v5 [Chlamydomonas reinhardtii]XP_042920553.1 uncharacterized protein CHLRE_10g461300v5 [Chlamydomonas reinhardtii]PNW78021.1 hypothetical protein CHLRE_10g461300v5 [Chlamydomonas reinhardtii]PNW78023.1 hypothetical protein CHLRE_10g461300v5 [Chlamydomonas reinhardtii]
MAPSTHGKTTLIEGLTVGTLPNKLAGPAKDLKELEAYSAWLRCGGTCGEGQVEPHVLSASKRYFTPTETMMERYDEVRTGVARVRTYKLHEAYQHKPFGLLYPGSNRGSVGSVAPVLIGGSESEFQVLVMLEPREVICEQLVQYLRHVDADNRNDMCPKQAEHLKRMWELLTPPKTSLFEELASYQSDPEDYKPPLREAWGRLLGSSYVFRSHPSAPSGAGQQQSPRERDLEPELLFAGAVVRLCLPPGNEWGFDDDEQELLADLCDQDTRDKGPWRLLLSASLEAEHSPEQLREAREVFLLCLQRLQIFAPSELLNTLNLVIVDSIGFDDGNARRHVLQRLLEENSDNVILMLERELGTMEPVLRHLANSPFMRKWVMARLDPDPGQARPNLTVMYYREKSGHSVPKRGQPGYAGKEYTGGEQIKLSYLQHMGSSGTNYLRPQLTSLTNKSRAAISTLLKEFVENHSDGGPAAAGADGVRTRVQRLVQEVSVFYSLPLLGQSISLELEAAVAQQHDGERTAAAGSSSAAGGSRGGRGLRPAAGGGAGGGGTSNGSGHMERATQVPPEQLAKALDDTNLHELLGTLALPQMDGGGDGVAGTAH